MRRPATIALVAAALALAATSASAQGQASGSMPTSPLAAPSASAPAAGNADAALGAALASQGAPGVAPCASCHGAQGEGQAAAGFPRLAGQSAAYLERQLTAYAEGYRVNAVMQPIAKAMTPAQRAAAAAHYGALMSLAAARAPAGSASPSSTSTAPKATPASAANQVGRSLATVGATDRTLQACANCHGPQGVGEMATYPALAGQHASYLKNALAEWKDGSRRTDPTEQMPRIAKLLSDAEIDSLAAYYASLPPPEGARPGSEVALRNRPSIVSGPTPRAQNASAQGSGTEQGAPLSGGTQGVGSAGNPTGPRSGAPTSVTGPGASQPAGR